MISHVFSYLLSPSSSAFFHILQTLAGSETAATGADSAAHMQIA